jgi:hypothetical protein
MLSDVSYLQRREGGISSYNVKAMFDVVIMRFYVIIIKLSGVYLL